ETRNPARDHRRRQSQIPRHSRPSAPSSFEFLTLRSCVVHTRVLAGMATSGHPDMSASGHFRRISARKRRGSVVMIGRQRPRRENDMGDAEAGRVRDFVGYGRRPPDPRWPNGAHVAVNFVINYEEGGEYAVPDGDKASEAALTEGATAAVSGRDLAAESMFMYGSRAGFWRLYRMFTRRNLPCTGFAVARALERNAEASAAIREAGWDVAGHGLRWEMHANLAPETEREHIRLATEIITKCIGRRPEGWYSRYAPSLSTRSILLDAG